MGASALLATSIPLNDSALKILWWKYWALAMVFSFAIRTVLTAFRSYRLIVENGGGAHAFCCYFFRTLAGLGHKEFDPKMEDEDKKERIRGDYLTAYILGVLELATFPFLFAAGLYEYVGAWIGLKVVAQYKHWTEDRGSFTAFLIGNALVLIFAFTCLQGYVYHKA